MAWLGLGIGLTLTLTLTLTTRRGLAEVWQSMQARGDLTPMHFPEALRLLAEHVAEALAGATPPWLGLGLGLPLPQPEP